MMGHEPWGNNSKNVMMGQYHDPNEGFNMLPDDDTFPSNVQEKNFEENHD